MRIYTLLFLLLLASSSFAQVQLKGKIIDALTEEPVSFATVYINGTTKGAYTEDDGSYVIENVTFPIELVVSHVGYETQVVYLDSLVAKSIIIKVKSSSVEIETVKVVDNNKRRDNLREFTQYFLGMDELGTKAELLNDEVLRFDRDYAEASIPKKAAQMIVENNISIDLGNTGVDGKVKYNRPLNLKATSREPLIVDQPELGYKIRVDLVSFENIYPVRGKTMGRTAWLGHYYFEPYKTDKKRLQKRFAKNRQLAFYHSTQHFMRSLFNQKIPHNGYRLFERVENPETRKVDYIPYDITEHLKYIDDDLVEIKGLKDKVFYLFYYYKGKGYPIDLSFGKKGKLFVQSELHFLADSCYVRSNGTTPGTNILFAGPISEKKVGSTLPDDYVLTSYKKK
ncbi:MAG: carboxypeptidase-like regulatory domain-containing protein [Bacteroidota bacterium]